MSAIWFGRAAFRGARFTLGFVLLVAVFSSPSAAYEPTVGPTEIPTVTPTPTSTPTEIPTATPTPSPLPEYLVLSAKKEDEDGNVRLHYTCDFQRYDYRGTPVDVYLAAVAGPRFTDDEPFNLGTLFDADEVRIFRADMGTYVSNGVVEGPTFRGAVFTSAESSSLLINTVSSEIYRQPFAFAAAFVRSGTGEFVATDGFPVAGSGIVTPFQYRAVILDRTIHVGDDYDSYMADWEVPNPEGLSIDVRFSMAHVPNGLAVLHGGYWGTYYRNAVYLNGSYLGAIPGLMNGNHWAWSTVYVSPERFREGGNTMGFRDDINPETGHWDNYMAKGWELHYN